MTASRINPTTTDQGGMLIASQVEPQFSFVDGDVVFGTTRDQADPNHDYPVVQQYDFGTGASTTLLNLRLVTPVDPDTYAGALSSSATSPEKVSIMFGGPGQDRHFKVAVFQVSPAGANPVILNTRDSLITRNGITAATSLSLGFLLHHAWIDLSGRYVLLYPVAQSPFSYLVWDLETDAITPVTTRPFGHDAVGYGMQVNQDCCTSSGQDAAQWQFRTLSAPAITSDLIHPVLTPAQTFLADHTSWNNARPDRRVPILSSLYRYYKNSYNTTPWRAWDDEIVAIDTSGAGTVWRFAHHRSDITADLPGDGTYFWYQPHANISPNGRWALFTSNWEKSLGIAAVTEPDGLYRTDVFLVALGAGTFTDDPILPGAAGGVQRGQPDAPLGHRPGADGARHADPRRAHRGDPGGDPLARRLLTSRGEECRRFRGTWSGGMPDPADYFVRTRWRRSASPIHAANSAMPNSVSTVPAGIHISRPASCWSARTSTPRAAAGST
jgi:hypothetical protein